MKRGSDGKTMPSSREVIEAMRQRTDTILLSFSTGKDSVAMWLRLRKVFPHIHPFYMYLVPGLRFVERTLAYYESFFETRIHRVPHPSLYRMLRGGVFQLPETWDVLESTELPEYGYQDVYAWVREDLGLSPDTFVALGLRFTDSLFALTRLKDGVIREDERTFFPVWDLDKHRLIVELKRAGVKLPVDYRLFGRSFDGVYAKFTKPLRDVYPEDYNRICQLFPLAEADIKRWEFYGRRNQRTLARR